MSGNTSPISGSLTPSLKGALHYPPPQLHASPQVEISVENGLTIFTLNPNNGKPPTHVTVEAQLGQKALKALSQGQSGPSESKSHDTVTFRDILQDRYVRQLTETIGAPFGGLLLIGAATFFIFNSGGESVYSQGNAP